MEVLFSILASDDHHQNNSIITVVFEYVKAIPDFSVSLQITQSITSHTSYIPTYHYLGLGSLGSLGESSSLGNRENEIFSIL